MNATRTRNRHRHDAEWGPAHLRERREAQAAVQAALDLRDGGGDRPDDN